MSTETPEFPADDFDAHLQTLFAGFQPAAGFEDRLVETVRRHRRLRLPIPAAVTRAAIAAAAMLAVGVVGYYGNRGISGNHQMAFSASQPATAPGVIQNTEDAALQAQLDHHLPELRFNANGFSDVVDFLRDVTGANIYVDWPALQRANIAKDAPVTAHVRDVKFSKALDLVLNAVDGGNYSRKLGYQVNQGVITISTRNELNKTAFNWNFGSGIDSRAGKDTGEDTPDSDTNVSKGATGRVPYDDIVAYSSEWPRTSEMKEGIVGKDRERTVENLVRDARQYEDEGKYTEALAAIGNIKKLDPQNKYANDTSAFLEDKANNQEQRKWQGALDASLTSQYNPAVEGKAPYDTTVSHGNAAADAKAPGGTWGQAPPSTYFKSADDINKAARIVTVNGQLGLQGQNSNSGTAGVTGGTTMAGGTIVRSDNSRLDSLDNYSVSAVDEKGGRSTSPDQPPSHMHAGVYLNPIGSQDLAGAQAKATNSNAAEQQQGGQSPPALNDPLDPKPDSQSSNSQPDQTGGQVPATESRVSYGNQPAKAPQIVAGTLQLPMIEVQHQKTAPIPLAAPPTNTTQPAAVIDDRKIIRTGTMEFDVDRFDTAQMQITRIVLELGGFVGATDSTKLPNGKVRGSISVRVPPERLDVLVLSLRALGDLKSQQIVAADITKEYTDVESELAADRAMQDRLLELIHNGKGAVKDLLAAENELGNWRAKIEKAEGMIRYYNGQVGLSTLTITLSERDIQTPATAIETETADVGIEADDVEKARNSALKAIDDVKGRIVEAELKRFDAGQLAARLVADVPPESAGAVIDQLKQLGKVARLEINRQAATSDGSNAVTATTPLKTERKPTRLLVSIYNLANVAPRRTTNVSLAATDVEAAYAALVSAAKSVGGRVVTSALDRGDPVKATGSMVLEFPPDKFESALTALHAQGDVLKLTLTENPDTQNSTEAKQGLTVQLVSLASVPPRESVQQTLAAADVPSAYQAVRDAAAAAHARIQSAELNEQDRQNITADLQLEIPRSSQSEFDRALAAAGGTIARTSTHSTQAEGTVDSKVSLHLSITSADHLPPRETTRLQVEVPEVDRAANNAQAATMTVGGRVLEATVTRDHGKGLARVALDLPLDKAADILQQIRNEGTVRGIDASRDPQAPAGPLAHAQILVEFTTTDAIVADQTGPWASVRQGLSTSIRGLLWSLQWVVVGLCLIGPWAGVGWIIHRLWRRKIRMTKFEASNQ